MRADRLQKELTPTLFRLAEHGVRFRAARSPVPLTLPSHVSLMSGLLPPAHGVRENGDVLSPDVPRLAVRLREAGYDTGAFVGAFVLDGRFGLREGFDRYDDRVQRELKSPDRLEAERPAEEVVTAALSWLDQRPPTAARPYFLWIHLYDPHAPYRPPPGHVPAGLAPYDGEIAYVDVQVGRIVDRMTARGDFDRSIIVVAADHGESLGEHGERTHGMLLYEATLRVPLIVRSPNIAPAIRHEPVSLVDLFPTVLRLAGLDVPPGLDGTDLFAETPARDRDVYSETTYPRVAGWSPLAALVTDRWKLIQSNDIELYDLERDGGEQQNLYASRQPLAAALRGRLRTLVDKPGVAIPTRPITPEAADRLRALGYVTSAGVPAHRSNTLLNPASVITRWGRFEEVLDLLLAGRAAEALPDARALAEEFPDGSQFQVAYARALQDTGRPQEALLVYRQTVSRVTSDAALLHDLAVAARAAGETDEAVRAERAAVALRPDFAAAHNGLGLALIDQRAPALALPAFVEAARLDPGHAPFHINLGNARRETSDWAGAEAAYRRALEIDPNAIDAANGLGAVLVVTGRSADAIPWFERAVAAEPGFYEARLNLGIAYQEAGQTGQAEAAYRAVLDAPAGFERERDAARTLLTKLRDSRR